MSPSRLTSDEPMNQVLDTTDQPVGKVVQPLHFRRQTISYGATIWMRRRIASRKDAPLRLECCLIHFAPGLCEGGTARISRNSRTGWSPA